MTSGGGVEGLQPQAAAEMEGRRIQSMKDKLPSLAAMKRHPDVAIVAVASLATDYIQQQTGAPRATKEEADAALKLYDIAPEENEEETLAEREDEGGVKSRTLSPLDRLVFPTVELLLVGLDNNLKTMARIFLSNYFDSAGERMTITLLDSHYFNLDFLSYDQIRTRFRRATPELQAAIIKWMTPSALTCSPEMIALLVELNVVANPVVRKQIAELLHQVHLTQLRNTASKESYVGQAVVDYLDALLVADRPFSQRDVLALIDVVVTVGQDQTFIQRAVKLLIPDGGAGDDFKRLYNKYAYEPGYEGHLQAELSFFLWYLEQNFDSVMNNTTQRDWIIEELVNIRTHHFSKIEGGRTRLNALIMKTSQWIVQNQTEKSEG